jgi:hypothetical protein
MPSETALLREAKSGYERVESQGPCHDVTYKRTKPFMS